MKHLFSTLLLLGSLASCSHDAATPTPTPTLTGGQWALQTENVLATPKDGTPAITIEVAPMTGPVTLTFQSERHFSVDVKPLPTHNGYHFDGSYTYQADTLKFPTFYSWNTRAVVPRTVQVTELSAHKLVTQENWASPDTWYVTTHTYTR